MTQNQNQNLNQNQTALDYPRLSTHILLGDHLRERNPDKWLTGDGACGCALGGAMLSAGKVSAIYPKPNTSNRRTLPDGRVLLCGPLQIFQQWPWLGKSAPFNNQLIRASLFPLSVLDGHYVNLPWGSYGPHTGSGESDQRSFLWAISDLFIRVHHGSLTMESLVDQVRLWEEVYDDQLIATFAADSNHGQGDRDLAADAESIIEPVSVL